jgi:hypothetical protein
MTTTQWEVIHNSDDDDGVVVRISDEAFALYAAETANNQRSAARHQILVAIAFGIVAGYFLLRDAHSILEWVK